MLRAEHESPWSAVSAVDGEKIETWTGSGVGSWLAGSKLGVAAVNAQSLCPDVSRGWGVLVDSPVLSGAPVLLRSAVLDLARDSCLGVVRGAGAWYTQVLESFTQLTHAG